MNTQIIHQNQSKGLALMGGQPTMTSIELRELINAARKELGESPVRNDQLIMRIEDELEGELGVCKTFAHPQSGVKMRYYDLTLDQCLLVGMRESKAVRRSVLAELKKRQNKVPQTLPEALRLAADLAEQNELLSLERDEAIRTKAMIGTRREATAMATASAAKRKAKRLEAQLDQSMQYASIKRMEMLYHGQKFNWRLLRSVAMEMGIRSIDIFDANYGTVKAYHADVWREAYALDINVGEA